MPDNFFRLNITVINYLQKTPKANGDDYIK